MNNTNVSVFTKKQGGGGKKEREREKGLMFFALCIHVYDLHVTTGEQTELRAAGELRTEGSAAAIAPTRAFHGSGSNALRRSGTRKNRGRGQRVLAKQLMAKALHKREIQTPQVYLACSKHCFHLCSLDPFSFLCSCALAFRLMCDGLPENVVCTTFVMSVSVPDHYGPCSQANEDCRCVEVSAHICAATFVCN